jgi:ubiquinone/menaquinone biosynthesis C-methylase UbiE
MQRITEPELMNEPGQAVAYANADFEAPHRRVIELFRRTFPDWPGTGRVLDLGCGPGDIAMRFARAYPECMIDGIDGAAAMLDVGRDILKKDPSLQACVNLLEIMLPHQRPPHDQYDAVISNSLLHHLHDPCVLWNAVAEFAKPDAPVFIIDLMRPDSPTEAQRLTDLYTVGAPDVLRRDFHASLFASFTPSEVAEQLQSIPALRHLQVSAISDRHLMVWGTLLCPIKPPSLI